MPRNILTKMVLLLAFVFAQTVYANHSVDHIEDNLFYDCSLCLLSSEDDGSQISTSCEQTPTERSSNSFSISVYSNHPCQLANTPPSRAPPVSLN